MQANVVTIGAGYAADCVAAALRQYGWTGGITMVGDEAALPYDRPPLSKSFLNGTLEEHELALRPTEFYAQQGIDVRLGRRVVSIDRDNLAVLLDDGTRLDYQYLVIATGSRHRVLDVPGASHPGVLQLRTVADAQKLKARVVRGSRLGIVGGGYIGLEVAASMKALGVTPIVVERENRLLARVASEEFSNRLLSMHEANGTQFLLDSRIEALCPLTGIHLVDGHVVNCDAVLVGIGALANDALAISTGLACRDGVLVDDDCRTTDPSIFAVGDCCRRTVPGYGQALRLESIPSAQEHAKAAASAIVGKSRPANGVPWFWSDQFASRIQIAGLLLDVRRSFVRKGADGGTAIFHVDDESRIRAVEALDCPSEFMLAKALIRAKASVPAELEQAPLGELRKLQMPATAPMI